MPHLLLGKILETTSTIKKDGSAWIVPEELDGNAYIAIGAEVLQLTKLARIEVAADVVTFTTYKNERFFFPPEQVVGLRLGGPEARARLQAGFSNAT